MLPARVEESHQATENSSDATDLEDPDETTDDHPTEGTAGHPPGPDPTSTEGAGGMSDTLITWKARESAALNALLREAGVSDPDIEAGGPDGDELTDLIFADVDTWNDFGIIAQDFDATDEDVHARLTAGFVVIPQDEWTWELEAR